MSEPTYYAPTGGLPAQTELTTDRAMFTEAYAVLPRGTMTDIVTSFLPFWTNMRMWIIARPLSGLPRLLRSTSLRFPRWWQRQARARSASRRRAVCR